MSEDIGFIYQGNEEQIVNSHKFGQIPPVLFQILAECSQMRLCIYRYPEADSKNKAEFSPITGQGIFKFSRLRCIKIFNYMDETFYLLYAKSIADELFGQILNLEQE